MLCLIDVVQQGYDSFFVKGFRKHFTNCCLKILGVMVNQLNVIYGWDMKVISHS